MGEDDMPKGERWRTLDDSWLDMEGEDGDKAFHINVVMEDAEPRGRKTSLTPA
jgi:hypothetical protein